MRAFDLLQPGTVEEALEALHEYGDNARLIAGGAMLTILLRERLIDPTHLISLLDIPGLDEIASESGELRIGATATLRSIEQSLAVQRTCAVLSEAAHLVGNIRVRNVATIGGHLAQADVHLDLPPVLAALRAEVDVQARSGQRAIRVEDFFTGYYETSLAPDEMIVRLRVPVPPLNLRGAYLKYCSLSPNDWPTVGVAAFLQGLDGRASDVRIVVGSVSERPLRLPEAEAILEGERLQLSAIAEVGRRYAAAADPLPDHRGSVEYKREVTAVCVRRAIAAAAERAGLAIGAGA